MQKGLRPLVGARLAAGLELITALMQKGLRLQARPLGAQVLRADHCPDAEGIETSHGVATPPGRAELITALMQKGLRLSAISYAAASAELITALMQKGLRPRFDSTRLPCA